MEEEWRKCGICDNYSVSNMGNVWNDKTGKILKLIIDADYYVVSFSMRIGNKCVPKW